MTWHEVQRQEVLILVKICEDFSVGESESQRSAAVASFGLRCVMTVDDNHES